LSDIGSVARDARQYRTATARIVGLLENIEKRLVRRLMKGSRKQPWLIVFIIVFLSMKKKEKKKVEPEKDENYWRVLGGL
jgi:hypothetical protein